MSLVIGDFARDATCDCIVYGHCIKSPRSRVPSGTSSASLGGSASENPEFDAAFVLVSLEKDENVGCQVGRECRLAAGVLEHCSTTIIGERRRDERIDLLGPPNLFGGSWVVETLPGKKSEKISLSCHG